MEGDDEGPARNLSGAHKRLVIACENVAMPKLDRLAGVYLEKLTDGQVLGRTDAINGDSAQRAAKRQVRLALRTDEARFVPERLELSPESQRHRAIRRIVEVEPSESDFQCGVELVAFDDGKDAVLDQARLGVFLLASFFGVLFLTFFLCHIFGELEDYRSLVSIRKGDYNIKNYSTDVLPS